MIFQKGINWNDYEPKYKRGRVIVKEHYIKKEDEKHFNSRTTVVVRTRWISTDIGIFTQERQRLSLLIPFNEIYVS